MPAIVGVKFKLLANSAVPPTAVAYQLTLRPAATFAVKAGIGSPAQIVAVAGFTIGAVMGGQEQSGAVMDSGALGQPLSVAVMVMLVPVGMPLMLLPETAPNAGETEMVPPVLLKTT